MYLPNVFKNVKLEGLSLNVVDIKNLKKGRLILPISPSF